MDGKRVFQERTNILNWADGVKDYSSEPVSKRRSKCALNPLSDHPTGTQSISLPVTHVDTLLKSTTIPTFPPAMQVLETKDAPYNSVNGPAKECQIPEVNQHCQPASSQPVNRYIMAEKQLLESLRSYRPETSVQELQIRALRRAMSILNTHVADSKERVEELRSLLAERDIEPGLFKSMQRQRWMEEKRQIAFTHLSKVVEQHLAESPSGMPSPEGQLLALDLTSRSSLNLIMFFESPRQRIPTRRRVGRRVHVAPKPRQDLTDTPSVHYHRGVIPFLLKPSPQIPAFLQKKVKTKQANKSFVESPTTSQALFKKPKPSINALAQLAPISEIPQSNPTSRSHAPGISTYANGSATIWRDSPRSKEEILAELVVNMPDYVDNLLAEFDAHSFTPTPLNVPQETKSAHSTLSKTTFVSETPKPQRMLGVPLHVHKSPSRKRISALFSLAEALSSRRAVNTESDRPKHLSTPPTATVTEESTLPFSVSFSALPSSDSGGSHEQEAEYKRTSRVGRRLSFFKRH